jgi:hypothetical protein
MILKKNENALNSRGITGKQDREFAKALLT